MLKRIRIQGYKSFANLELMLRPLSVIFGPNASGKSNLLDAIYLLSRMVTCRNLKEAFEGHRGLPLESFYYAQEGYESMLKRDSVRFSFEVDVSISPETVEEVRKVIAEKRRGSGSDGMKPAIFLERFLRYKIEIEADPMTGYLRVADERLIALRQSGEEKKSRGPFFEQVTGQGRKRISLRIEGQAHPIYHETGLDHTIVSMPLYEPHYPHIAAFRRELEKWKIFYLEPRSIMREEVPLSEVMGIGSRGENLPAFLNVMKYKRPRDFEGFNLALRTILPSATAIDVETTKLGLVGLVLSEKGVPYSARIMSEGTLRIIGLLGVLHPANRASVIGFEEPENGVHPVRLKLVSQLLANAAEKGKQVIVTTHSPRFPRYFDNESLFISRREGNETKIGPFRSLGPMFRRGDIEQALEEGMVRGDFGG